MDEMSKLYHMKRCSIDTTISSSFDLSDSEHSFGLHEEHSVASCKIFPIIFKNEVIVSAVDEKLLMRYKPLLRFIFFLIFQILLKKFQRLRKADKLLEMEAEIVGQIHERDQKLNEVWI